nr:hypothetical protein GCM10020092_067250 [Actinoplanes digitatis]
MTQAVSVRRARASAMAVAAPGRQEIRSAQDVVPGIRAGSAWPKTRTRPRVRMRW